MVVVAVGGLDGIYAVGWTVYIGLVLRLMRSMYLEYDDK